MGDKSRGFLERLLMSFFHVSVAQFKAEHSINQLEHQLTMLVSYVIYCMCTCNLLGLLSVGPVNFGAIGYVFLWLGFAYLLAYITLKIFNLINYSRIGFGDRPPLSIRLGARADYNLRKVVYPLIIWAFFGTVFAGQAAGALFWLPGITCLSLGTLLTFQITMYQKNTIPSDAFIAIFETTSEVPLLMVGVVAMVVGLFAQHQPNFSLKLSLNSLVFAINIANAVFFTLTKKFWSTKANLMILRYSYWILILDLWNYIHFLGVSQGFLAMGIILGFSLAEKIARNMNIYFSQIDPFDSKVSLRKRTLGFCILEDVISQQINGSLSKSDEPLYYFYRGLLYQYFLRKGKPEKATIICSDITKLHPFLAKMIGDEFKTNPMIKLTLRLQLLNLFDNLVFIRLLFSKLREGAKTSLDEKLDCFHLSQLVESKIMAYYQLKDIPANHKMKSLKIQYRHINDLCTLPIGSYYLDVSEPLKSKNMFISMSGTIKSIITNKQKLFDYVFETSGASKPNAHRLLTENEGVRNLMLKAGKLILRDIEAIQVLPLYFFPSLCTYFAIVRYDFDHLRQMRSRYKKEILKWKILLDRPLSLRMDALDADAVVLQISIQPNTSGLIVEASSNAEKKLEAPKAGQVVGRNVNELFTSMVAEQHKQLMRSSKGLGQLINTKRPFYIKDFAKELRQIYFMLKVMPVIDKDIFVLSSLSLIDNEKESLVVLSDSMQIVDAEQAFWNKLEDPKRFSKSNAKIEQLIPRIPLTIKLLQAFKEVEKALETEEIIVEKGSALASLTQFISQFCALNRDSKLEFTAAADPIWRRTSRELTFLCKIEEFHFKEVSLFSLFITFTSSDTVRGGTFYHNKELKKSAKPDEEPMIKLQQHEGPSGSDFDSEEYERIHREDEYLDKIHSIGSQIRSLKNILGNTQPTDLKFCTPALRKGLSEIIRLLGLFYDLYEANVSIKKIDHRKQTFVNAALNHERFASLIRVDLKSPLPDSRAVLAEQPKHSTTTMLDLLEKSKGLEAVTEVQEDPTSFQEVEDLIRNHRKRVETPTYYRGKLKENAIQSPSFRKKHKNPKPKNISSFQQAAFGEDGPDFPRRPKLKIIVQSISAWLRLSKVRSLYLVFD